MHNVSDQRARIVTRLREVGVSAAIVVGGLLMVAGSVHGVLRGPDDPETLAALWPFYLAGVVAIVVGWMNGDWE